MTKIEKQVLDFFKIPLEQVIKEMHFKKEISLNELSKMSGISRQSIKNCCDRLGIQTRSIKEATALTKNKGPNHFMWGKTKESCVLALASSNRMKKRNPIKNKNVAIKRANSISKTFSDNLLKQEIKFKNILDENGIKYEIQKPIDKYNLDFFIPDKNLGIEIDSTAKWGKQRKEKAKVRDDNLMKYFCIKTLRIDKRLLDKKSTIIDILKTNNIII